MRLVTLRPVVRVPVEHPRRDDEVGAPRHEHPLVAHVGCHPHAHVLDPRGEPKRFEDQMRARRRGLRGPELIKARRLHPEPKAHPQECIQVGRIQVLVQVQVKV